MPDLGPTDTTDGTWGGIDLTAVKTLIAHQRRDIGSCICGWGVNAGDLGRSHALHVWRVLQVEVLPDHDARVRADERARWSERLRQIADQVEATWAETDHNREIIANYRAMADVIAHATTEDST